MNVLVIGGAGYVGSALVPALQKSHTVSVMDTFWFGNHLPPDTRIINKNALDITKEDYAGIDAVIFLAALSNDPMSEMLPKECFVYNTAMPLHCAMLAKASGVKKFIFASSCSVYGYSPNEEQTPESPISCNYPYGLSKRAAESGLLALQDDFFNVVILRKGTISGYSPRMRYDLLINTMYKNATMTGVLKVNNPNLWRPMLAMKDAVAAYGYALKEDIFGIYNVVSFNSTIGQIARDAQSMWRNWDRGELSYEVSFVGDMRNYRAKNTLPLLDYNSVYDILVDIDSFKPLSFDDPLYYNAKICAQLKDAGKI